MKQRKRVPNHGHDPTTPLNPGKYGRQQRRADRLHPREKPQLYLCQQHALAHRQRNQQKSPEKEGKVEQAYCRLHESVVSEDLGNEAGYGGCQTGHDQSHEYSDRQEFVGDLLHALGIFSMVVRSAQNCGRKAWAGLGDYLEEWTHKKNKLEMF